MKNKKLRTTLVFELIETIICKFDFKNMVSHLCKITEVSTSGYYSYLKTCEIRNHREEKGLKLREIILKTFNYRGYKKKSRSIKMILQHNYNVKINRKCIQRIMRKAGSSSIPKPTFSYMAFF